MGGGVGGDRVVTAYAKKKQEDIRNQAMWNETLEEMQREQAWF